MQSNQVLEPPMVYFGGKRYIAAEVWQRFGKCDTYIEPFCGSCAVLLANPHWQTCTETINDIDHFICNVWRSLKYKPDETAYWADFPVNEAQLHAIHVWLVTEGKKRILRCESDHEFCDPQVAGYWLYGNACWIGVGWCSGDGWWTAERLAAANELGTYDKDEIMRQLPHLGSEGQGVNRQFPHLGDGQQETIYPFNLGLREYLRRLAVRLRRVRVCCGNWSRICQPAVTWAGENAPNPSVCAVFLDPPYSNEANRYHKLYAEDSDTVALDVLAWCKTNGANPNMRIALCGYEGEPHHELEKLGWSVFEWKATVGMSGFSNSMHSKNNRNRERVWFSPYCCKAQQGQLF